MPICFGGEGEYSNQLTLAEVRRLLAEAGLVELSGVVENFGKGRGRTPRSADFIGISFRSEFEPLYLCDELLLQLADVKEEYSMVCVVLALVGDEVQLKYDDMVYPEKRGGGIIARCKLR